MSYASLLRAVLEARPNTARSILSPPLSVLKKAHEWAINELVPADARNSSRTESLFDFNNVNATFNYYSYPVAPERDINIFSALGGIYNSEATSGAATWLFEHHLNILLSANVSPSYYFPTSVMLAFEKYAYNSAHPDSISSMPEKTFYLGRGFIIRDGYADNGTLFSFETNFNYNQETGKTSFRWDENDNNSFTFFSNGRRWVIDSGKSISQPDEKASYHNTILIDNQEPVIPFDVSQQVINWYDYHYLNGQYYITSDVTDSQTKRVQPDPDPYNDFSGNGLTQTYTTPFSSFKRARRHAQIVLAKDNVPSYAVILDDIQVDSSSHDYKLLLQTGVGNTVGTFDSNNQSVKITSSGKISDVFYYSPSSPSTFSTSTLQTSTDGQHKRLEYKVNSVNPHFQTIIIPSNSASSPVTNLTHINLNSQGAVSKVEFSTNTDITDYNMFAYQKSVNNQGYALEGFREPHEGSGVTGVYAYARKKELMNEFTDMFLSLGSYLNVDNKSLIDIGGSGRYARIIVNNNIVDIYKVQGSERYSYKVYGKNISSFKLYGSPIDYTAFNEYNYSNSQSVISNETAQYYVHSDGLNTRIGVNVSWHLPETHDVTIYYWKQSDPSSVYIDETTGLSAGTNQTSLIVQGPVGFVPDRFRIEGKIASDNYIDLTNEFSPQFLKVADTNLPTDYGLSQNYPNPFNPVTTIAFQLPEAQQVKLSIYNILGQEVARLVDSPIGAGYHSIRWNATEFASGIYIYRIEAGEFTEIKRLTLLK